MFIFTKLTGKSRLT